MKVDTMNMKILGAVGLLALASGVVSAQTWNPNEVRTEPTNKRTSLVASLDSGTTPQPVDVNAPYESVYVYCQSVGVSSVSETLVQQMRDGTTLASSSYNCSTTPALIVSYTAGTYGFSQLLISPTAGLTAANTVKNIVVKNPSQFRQ